MSMPTADVSVRVAWSADADGIAGCQIRAWRQIYADLLPPSVIEELDPADFAEKWTVSMDQPGDAGERGRARMSHYVSPEPQDWSAGTRS